MPFGLSSKFRMLILSQFDESQIIARIVLGSISPCLRFSMPFLIIREFALQFVTHIVSGCRTNFMLTLRVGLFRLFKGVRIRELRSNKMYFTRVILSTFRTWALSNCNIYLRSYSYACMVTVSTVEQASGTRENGSGDSNLSSLQRAL